MRLIDIRVAVCILILTAGSSAATSHASNDTTLPGEFRAVAAHTADEVASKDEIEAAPLESTTVSALDPVAWDGIAIGGVDPRVFSLALASAESAVERGDAEPSSLTVIDFSQPSTDRRMWVYDLRSRVLLFEEHVSHGRNSGHNLPTMFSNDPESYKSSIGLYRAAESYFGKHGYSLRLDGLEKGFNDRARERAIVIHGAEYVNAQTARAQGRLGRSLGCPAVRPAIVNDLIDSVKDGGLIFAYYPDPDWLSGSTYLN
jgi:hypothetical protein